tara:strand:+ start:1543 stop:3570 length:2028 start_codon:yes stop_codon:yes gene_type:complete
MASVIREYTLKLTTKEAQKNLKEVTDSLELQDNAINRINKDLIKYEKQLADTVGFTGMAMSKRTKLNELIAKTKRELKEETLARKQIVKEQQKSAKQLQQAKKDTADFGGVMRVLDSATGGAASSMTNLVGGVGGATKGFKGMRLAIMATGIGALVIAVTSLATAFTHGADGQNEFIKIMNRIKVVVGNVTDILSSLGKSIIAGGKALYKLAKGDLKGASDSWNELKENVNDAGNAIKNFGSETAKEFEIADRISKLQIKNAQTQRDLTIERAEANAEIAKLRETASDKFNVSVEERIAALTKAASIEDGIAAKELQLAKDKLTAHQLEMSLSETSNEQLDEEAKLIAAVSKVEEERATKKRMLIRTTSAAQKEADADALADQKILDDAAKDADDKEIQAAKDLLALKKEIRDAEANTEEEERALELLKIQEHFDALILQAEENDLVTDELKASRDEMLAEKKAEFMLTDEERRQKELDDIKKIEEKKRKMAMKTLDTAARMVGEHTKLGKAMLLAKQVMLIKQMIMDAKSQISTGTKVVAEAGMQGSEAGVEVAGSIAKGANAAPPPANIPFILSAIATGIGIIASVKSAIKATKSAASSVGAPSVAGAEPVVPQISPTAPILPDITSVGQDNVSQLAGAIGGQSQPVQAFVVSNDVTTSQSLERNIIDSASIG